MTEKNAKKNEPSLDEVIAKLISINAILSNEMSTKNAITAIDTAKTNTKMTVLEESEIRNIERIADLELTLDSVVSSLKAMRIESASLQIALQTQLQKSTKEIKNKDEMISNLEAKVATLEATINELKYSHKATINSLHNSYTSIAENALSSILKEIRQDISDFKGESNKLTEEYLSKIRRCLK